MISVEMNLKCHSIQLGHFQSQLLPRFLKKYNLKITFEFADEDIGSNAGVGVFENGKLTEYDSKDGDYEFCCQVKGYTDWEQYKEDW